MPIIEIEFLKDVGSPAVYYLLSTLKKKLWLLFLKNYWFTRKQLISLIIFVP